ncbi:MAG: sugar phosphate isomerase/epimerase family protein [Christensenellales bacterium]
MKKGINLYFNTDDNIREKLIAVKNAGYDEFFIGINNIQDFEQFRKDLEFAKNIGLNCTMIHCYYYEPILNDFWLDNETGDKVEKDYINQLELCKGMSDNFVVHLNGNYGSKQTKIGLQRIRDLLDVCSKNNMNLCIENLYSTDELGYIFSNIKHNRLKVCFDTGHRNFLTPSFDVIENFGDYISVLHIHDNDGKTDQHKFPYTGNIDWEVFAKKISKYPNLTLSCELKGYEFDEMLKGGITALNKLENSIQQYKK